MRKDLTFDNNFPQFHRNDVTEAESLKVLDRALPADRFIVRNEHRDRGVDLSIEVIDDQLNKNFRAQIQIKGKEELQPLANGDYSIPIETSNLNYLLNSPISLYFLYIKSAAEIRFAWTWDERVRIEAENPDWIKQNSVNLRFFKVLNETSIEEIRQRIMAHGKGIRAINENLFFANSTYVTFEIDPHTFEVTDLRELQEIIVSKGIGFCIRGGSDWVLEKIRVLPQNVRRSSKIQIVEIVAHFEKTNFQRARECIASLRSDKAVFSPDERILMDFVKLNCDAATGTIEYSELVEQLRLLSIENTVRLPYNIRLAYLQKSLWLVDDEEKRFDGSNERKRRAIFEKLKEELRTCVTSDPENELDLRNEFALLKVESELIMGEAYSEIAQAMLTIALGTENLDKAIEKYTSEIGDWHSRITGLLARSKEPQMFADIVCQQAYLFFLKRNWELLLQKHSAYRAQLNPEACEEFQLLLQAAVSIYDQLELILQKLKAQIWLAGFHFINGRMADFTDMQRSVVETANDYNLADVVEEAKEPLYLQGQRIITKTEDQDQRNAKLDQRTIEIYAQQRIDAFSLPRERLQNVRLSFEMARDRAIEHLKWCENFELLEDERHTISRSTMYRINPDRIARCLKHGYESNIERPDWKIVTAEFKNRFCDSCPDRQPKQLGENVDSS